MQQIFNDQQSLQPQLQSESNVNISHDDLNSSNVNMIPIQSNLDPQSNLSHQTTMPQYTPTNLGTRVDVPLNQRTNIYRKGKRINRMLT